MTRANAASILTLLCALCTSAHAALAQSDRDPLPHPEAAGLVQPALLTYAGGMIAECFAPLFLRLVEYETDIAVAHDFAHVRADAAALFNHPFAILSGEGAFDLSDTEIANLRDFVTRGGLLVASAGCTNKAWDASMRRALERLFPDHPAAPIPHDHELFHTVYDLSSLTTRTGRTATLLGIELDGRMAVVYAPEGLNATDDAGGTCCCCGGDEIREARFLNANLLVYALLR